MMDKTLKTYPDGSEFTVKYLLASYALGIAGASVLIGAYAWREHRATKKFNKKFEAEYIDIPHETRG